MGGIFNVTVAVLAAIAFVVAGNTGMSIVAGIVAIICFAAWQHIRFVARQLARNRLYVAALRRGEITEQTPEAELYWRQMPVTIDVQDAEDVPNWIAGTNLVAFLTALVLLIWGLLAAGAVPWFLSTPIVIVTGLVLYFGLANVIDGIIFRLAVGPGDPVQNILATGPDLRRAIVLNILRPMVLTVIIFGSGMATVGVLRFPTLGTVLAGAWFFLLTQHACLAGRGPSHFEAGLAMLLTIGGIIAAYMVVF